MDTNLFQKLKELEQFAQVSALCSQSQGNGSNQKLQNCGVAKTLMSSYILCKVWDLSERICPKVVRRLLILTYLQTLQNNGYCFYKNVNHKNMHDSTHTGVS